MFFDSWEVKDEDVQQFRNKHHLFIENMDEDYLQNLHMSDALKNENGIRNYLLILQPYEYLAFAHALTFSTKYLGRWSIGKRWERFRNERLDKRLSGKTWIQFPHSINDNYSDPYGEKWIERWVEILIEDPDFPEVHISYRKDHPEFYRFVNDIQPDFYKKFVKDREELAEKEDSANSNSK